MVVLSGAGFGKSAIIPDHHHICFCDYLVFRNTVALHLAPLVQTKNSTIGADALNLQGTCKSTPCPELMLIL